MYSPKIKEEFIPLIYRIAKNKGKRMTTLVNEIIRKALCEMEAVKQESIKNEIQKGDKR